MTAPIDPAEFSRGRVLVVDDEAPNRLLLSELLSQGNYEVVEANDGGAALLAATGTKPDVILLDVMLPVIDGFEVCRRLKAAPETRAVPVLFVTSLAARQERLEGIRVGASDFVTKPIDGPDLLLRVRNALTTKKLYDRLEQQLQQLRELEALRDGLVHMMIHDVRTPLTVFASYLEVLESDPTAREPGELAAILAELKAAARRMDLIVHGVLDVSRLESAQLPLRPERASMLGLAGEVAQGLGPSERRRVRIGGADAVTSMDRELIGRVLANLLSNALKYGGSDTEVDVHLGRGPRFVEVVVHDAGSGIPQEEQAHIFDKFQQGGDPRMRRGYGLGLTFCKLAVEAHGGEIGVRSAPGQGSSFWFRLPLASS